MVRGLEGRGHEDVQSVACAALSFLSNVKLSGHLLGRTLLRPPRDLARRFWEGFLGTARLHITIGTFAPLSGQQHWSQRVRPAGEDRWGFLSQSGPECTGDVDFVLVYSLGSYSPVVSQSVHLPTSRLCCRAADQIRSAMTCLRRDCTVESRILSCRPLIIIS